MATTPIDHAARQTAGQQTTGAELNEQLVQVVYQAAAPTATDDVSKGFYIGYKWVDTSTGITYECTDNSTGSAVWDTKHSGIVRCTQSVGTVIPNASATIVSFDTFAQNDVGATFSSGQVVTPSWAKFAEINGGVAFATAAANRFFVQSAKNGVAAGSKFRTDLTTTSLNTTCQHSVGISVVAGDLVGIKVYQSSGANNTTNPSVSVTGLTIRFWG